MTNEQKARLRALYERAQMEYALTEGRLESAIAKAKIDTLVLIAEIFGVKLG